MPPSVHSEEYISEERLEWWRPGHLSNILEDFGCKHVHSVLDVGVGQGHWTSLVLRCLPDGIDVTGVDFEAHWVELSQTYLGRVLPQHRYRALKGEANRLPVSSSSFDLVTCQTVLMHLGDPEGAIREMVRVLRPGGLLLISEPINQINRAAVSYSLASKLVKVSDVLWYLWRCFHERRREVQKGDHNIAARLPGMIGRFSELHGLKAYHSDVVLFSGPRHEGLSVLADELRRSENRQLMLEFGTTEAEIQRGIDGIQELIREMDEQEAIIASPTPNILFCARKKADPAHETEKAS